MESSNTVVLVTGANRGIGLEVCRQLAQQARYTVLLGSRDLSKGQAAADELAQMGLTVLPHALDVTDPESIERLASAIESEFGRLDVLVNNAAIHYDTWQRASTANLATVHEALETNLFGAWQLCLRLLPLLKRSSHGRIINVSSEAGSLASMGAGTPAYNVSKVALNALTKMLAAELRSSNILVNAVCPGWVATDMGGAGGGPVAEGAKSILWAITLPDNGPTGGFYRHGKPLPW
jgi:NAD(P)-dependent dehydrogenase (short-subunit alcohol dehydrogenase family)